MSCPRPLPKATTEEAELQESDPSFAASKAAREAPQEGAGPLVSSMERYRMPINALKPSKAKSHSETSTGNERARMNVKMPTESFQYPHTHTHIYIYIYIYIYTHTYICAHVYMHIYIYKCIDASLCGSLYYNTYCCIKKKALSRKTRYPLARLTD